MILQELITMSEHKRIVTVHVNVSKTHDLTCCDGRCWPVGGSVASVRPRERADVKTVTV